MLLEFGKKISPQRPLTRWKYNAFL